MHIDRLLNFLQPGQREPVKIVHLAPELGDDLLRDGVVAFDVCRVAVRTNL